VRLYVGGICVVYVNEVASGIAGLCGTIMVLTVPFEEIKSYHKSKNIDSKQV
jgi:hypothetical protein